MTRFNISEYSAAAAYAREQANFTKQNVAIRRVKEFGIAGYNVSFACKNDSDYALAEIVYPDR